MPTESAFLFAGLLFVAAGLGYVFAWFGERDRDAQDAPAVNRDYLRGLNFLLDEDADSALEVFAQMAETDAETLEIHFALGSLFRRRGEVDRAIRIHQNIMARPGLERGQLAQAQFALAEDYLSAGLLDRAEKLFSDLREAPELKARALSRLTRIHEQTQDWQEAIEVHAELEKVRPRESGVNPLAHYYCELADEALAGRELTVARDFLKRAAAVRPKSVRGLLVRGDLARQAGETRDALKLYRRVADEAPSLVAEVVPRVAALYRQQADEAGLGAWLKKLLARQPDAAPAVAMAVIADSQIDDPVALQALEDYLAGDRVLGALVNIEQLRRADISTRQADLTRIREALQRVLQSAPRYTCSQCGYASLTLQWQCPGCRQWETQRPQSELRVVS